MGDVLMAHQRCPARQLLVDGLLAMLAAAALVRPAAAAPPPVACDPVSGVKLAAPASGLYHAAFPFFARGDRNEDYVTGARLARFERLAGKPVAWAFFSQHWFRGIRFPAEQARLVWQHGALPFIRLMPWSADVQWRRERRFTLQRIIDGAFDADLRGWSRDAAASGIPLMVVFGVEVNGRWFPWNGAWNGGGRTTGYGDPAAPDGPERFRDAYRHVVDLFRAEGAANVTWAFQVNNDSVPAAEWNEIGDYYPGDAYVDWLGVSAYAGHEPDGQWDSLRGGIAGAYGQLVGLAPGKPIGVFEFGAPEASDRGRKARWISGALRTLRNGLFPQVKAASYWAERWRDDDGRLVDMDLASSGRARAAYRRGVASPKFVSAPQFECRP